MTGGAFAQIDGAAAIAGAGGAGFKRNTGHLIRIHVKPMAVGIVCGPAPLAAAVQPGEEDRPRQTGRDKRCRCTQPSKLLEHRGVCGGSALRQIRFRQCLTSERRGRHGNRWKGAARSPGTSEGGAGCS